MSAPSLLRQSFEPSGAGPAGHAVAVVRLAERAGSFGSFVVEPGAEGGVQVSAGLKEILDKALGDLGSLSLFRFFRAVHHEDRPRLFARLRASLGEGGGLGVDFRLRDREGEALSVSLSHAVLPDADGGVVHIGVLHDQTESRRREYELYENTALRQAITDAALDAIVITDEDGVIQEFNPNAELLFGYPKDEAVGLKIADAIVPARYRDAHNAGMRRYLTEGSIRVIGKRVEIEAIKQNGEEFPVELTVLPVRAGGRLLFTANIRDITDRRRAQDQLRNAKEAAEAASRAKSEFLAAMSHEIRTPLNGVLGVLTLLSDTDLDVEQRRLLKTAYASGQNLFTLISDVLDLSKIEAGRMEKEFVDFNPVAAACEAVDLAEATASQKSIDLRLKVVGEIPVVRSDQAMVRQILTNLVSNAVKFTDEGSVIISVRHEEDRLRYEVADTGIGIAEEHQAGLFEKFSQVDPSLRRRYGGTGLGLAICRELVRQLGGDIGLVSEAGVGSSFWFEIPVEKSAKAPEDLPPRFEAAPRMSIDARILLAEDSQTNALVAKGFLSAVGARVDVATNGLEVLEATENRSYDLIIMDVSMPDMDGVEATQALRARSGWTRTAPIIALTANASREDRRRCLDAGMDAFLTKPIERSKLLLGVQNALLEKARPEADGAAATAVPQTEAPRCASFDCDAIRRDFSDLPELFASILDAFKDELAGRLARAEAALEAGEPEAAGKEGHGLKGAAANVHARALSAAGRELEIKGRAGDLAGARAALAELKTLAEAARADIREAPFYETAK